MKIKDEIIRWRDEVAKLKIQNEKLVQKIDELNLDIKNFKQQVEIVNEKTSEMTKVTLSLLRVQAGD